MNLPSSNAGRRLAARNEIEKKLVVLRKYVLEGIPPGAFVPTSMTQFRKWSDESLELNLIGSPNTLNLKISPQNHDKIMELDGLLGRLRRQQKKPKKPRPSATQVIENLGEANSVLKRMNDALVSRVHELRNQLEILAVEHKSREKNHATLLREIAELRKNVSVLKRGVPSITRIK